jgi:hypothetical protein
MSDKKKGNDRKTLTPKFRVSFPWVFTPQPPMEGSPPGTQPKYGVVMLFDEAAQKTPEYEAMRKLANAAVKEKWGDKVPPNLRSPFRKGEEKADLEGYGPGVVFVSATSKMQPGLVNANLQKIISQDDFYAGCYARATVVAYAYEKAGNKGVAFGLNNLQKIGDGEAFSGRVKAEDDFEATESAFADDKGGADDFLG